MKLKMIYMPILFVGVACCSSSVYASEVLPELQVRGSLPDRLEQAGTLKDVIEKTEVITSKQIEQKQASSLSEIIESEPGIRVSAECSMCGMKRVMINGLKGEHTTILVDGVPMHSVVSGFYGVDAITSAGIEEIEVARGSGASLIAPEAIGGTINIVTKKARKNSITLDASVGEDGYKKYSAVGTAVSKDGKTRAVVSGQYDNIDQFDGDDNGVNESPKLENHAFMGKVSHDIGDNDNIEVRIANYKSDVFGGPTDIGKYEAVASEANATGADLFQGGDVTQTYTGDPWETLEAIDTTRDELILRWTHQIDLDSNWVLTGSRIVHTQDSYYEGVDYKNENSIFYLDGKYNRGLNENHFLTVGLDYRDEKMDSESAAIERLGIDGDSFDNSDLGFYIQDVWTPADNLEISMAIRFDNIEVDFTELGDDEEISETMVVPRLHARWDHNSNWVSRFSTGLGYRAPTAFFESEHGIIGPDGFAVAIDELEKSVSAGYALSYSYQNLTSTASLSWASVENLAYVDDSTAALTLRNSDEKGTLTTFDILAGYQINNKWTLNGGIEIFNYDDVYTSTFGVAPIEQRTRIILDYDGDPLEWSMTLTHIGSRDLSKYGYGDRYDVNNGGLSSPKGTDAPAFFTLDTKVSYQFTDIFSIYAGANNLLDYNQAADEETPLMWDDAGEYDVGHIYGPLRGRVAYFGIKAEL